MASSDTLREQVAEAAHDAAAVAEQIKALPEAGLGYPWAIDRTSVLAAVARLKNDADSAS